MTSVSTAIIPSMNAYFEATFTKMTLFDAYLGLLFKLPLVFTSFTLLTFIATQAS